MVAEDAALLVGQRPCAVVECPHAATEMCLLDQGPGLLIALCPRHAGQALDGRWGDNWDVPSNAADEGDGDDPIPAF
jgi:hypothetical protein